MYFLWNPLFVRRSARARCGLLLVLLLVWAWYPGGRVAVGAKPMHLIVLAGQSNMAGRGAVSDPDRVPHPRVRVLSPDGEWVPAVDPLHYDKPKIAGVGPGRTFAIDYADDHPDVVVGIVPCAVGGSSIDSWQPGAVHAGTGARPWDDAVARVGRAMESGQVHAILWHQGESDAKPGKAQSYEQALEDLVGRFRDLVGRPDVPFLIGQLGQFPSRPWDESRRVVDAAHQAVASRVPRCGFVSSLGLSHKGDNVHFSADSARELGHRYYREYRRIERDLRPEVLRCDRIWGQAPHNAFTDLIRFQDAWYCVFREGRGHVSPDGALRLLRSDDGHRWESVMRFTRSDADLRDAKLSITPQGELMLLGAGAMHNPDPHRHQTFAWFSEDAVSWTSEIPIGEPDYWLWRVSFHRGLGLGIGYTTNSPQDRHIRLYGSQDGRRWSTLVPRLYERGYPNETQIRFVGDRAYCLLRRDGASPEGNSGLLGIADPPYTDWNWSDLQVRIGGPAMLVTPHGKMIAVVRLYDGRTRTSVCQIDPVHGSIRELLALPSGGDTSYAGLVWYDDRLWISYYSAHEARSNAFATAIYLAEVTIP